MSDLKLPDWYEDFLFQSLKINVREKKSLKSLVDSLKQLKEGLTKKNQREGFIYASYLKEEKIRAAYTVYYMTNNLLKIFTPLKEIAKSGYFEKRKELTLLDIGSGPGTGVFGSLLWLTENTEIEKLHLTATDNVEQNLGLFQTLKVPFAHAVAGKREASLLASKFDIEKTDYFGSAPIDIITALNVVNEIGAAGENNFIDLLKTSLKSDGFAILIDPALHDTSRKLLMFRNLLVSEGFTVYSPCLMDSPCPALNHPKDWCHTEVHWERPGFIRELDDLVGNIHKSLKFSYLVVSKTKKRFSDAFQLQSNAKTYRVVSELMKEKGRSKVFLCNDEGRRLFVRQKKHKSDTNRTFDDLKRYDLISIDSYEERNDFCAVLSDSNVCFIRTAKD